MKANEEQRTGRTNAMNRQLFNTPNKVDMDLKTEKILAPDLSVAVDLQVIDLPVDLVEKPVI
jgi:hypothetical protein